MIVEKDRTQGEIDKRPDEKEGKDEVKEGSEVKVNEGTGDGVKEEDVKGVKEEDVKGVKEEEKAKEEQMRDEKAKEEQMRDEKAKEEKDKEEWAKEEQMRAEKAKEEKMKESNERDQKSDKDTKVTNEEGKNGKMTDREKIREAEKEKTASAVEKDKASEEQKAGAEMKEKGKEVKTTDTSVASEKDMAGKDKIGKEDLEGKDKAPQKQKVHFEELKNEKMDVSKDPQKSIKSPSLDRPTLTVDTGAVPLSVLKPNTELYYLRSDNKIAVEGPISKRMLFFSCFWHKRYFVLTNDGFLFYFRSLHGKGKGRMDLRNITDIRRINVNNSFKIMLTYGSSSESVRFDDERVRDWWNEKIRSVKESLT